MPDDVVCVTHRVPAISGRWRASRPAGARGSVADASAASCSALGSGVTRRCEASSECTTRNEPKPFLLFVTRGRRRRRTSSRTRSRRRGRRLHGGQHGGLLRVFVVHRRAAVDVPVERGAQVSRRRILRRVKGDRVDRRIRGGGRRTSDRPRRVGGRTRPAPRGSGPTAGTPVRRCPPTRRASLRRACRRLPADRVHADDFGADGRGQLVDGEQTHRLSFRAGRGHGTGSLILVMTASAESMGLGCLKISTAIDDHHERVHELRAGSPRPRAGRRAGTCRSSRSPPPLGGRRRRRTPASRPSSWPCAGSTARTRSPGTTWRANGSRSAKAAGSSASVIDALHQALPAALVHLDPVGHRLVEVADQDLLVAERELVAATRNRAPACVPLSVPASCSANSLNTTAATSCSTRSRTVVAGWKERMPSKRCVLCEVGQYRYAQVPARRRSGSRGSGRSGSCRCPTGRPGRGSPPASRRCRDLPRPEQAAADARPRSGT